MTCLLKVDVDDGGRTLVEVFNGFKEQVTLNLLDNTKSLNYFNWTITVGIESTFEIVDQHFADTYTVTTTNGTVKIVGNQVKYTPETVGVGGFTLNGTVHVVQVIKNQPVTPSILVPPNGTEVSSVYPVLQSSAYLSDDSDLIQSSSRWQIALDPDFKNIVVDVENSVNLTTFKSPLLVRGTRYYARVKHTGTK